MELRDIEGNTAPLTASSRCWNNMSGFGPIQKRVRRAFFVAEPGALLTTGELLRWCFPRLTGPARAITAVPFAVLLRLWR